jgi:hypothetical protein
MDNSDQIFIILLGAAVGYLILFLIIKAAVKSGTKEQNEKLQEIIELLKQDNKPG